MSTRAERPGMLHLVLTGHSDAWSECLAACSGEDTVLLLDAGVMGAAKHDPASVFPCRLAISVVDFRARGLAEAVVSDTCEWVDDAAIIDLIEAHARCLSWS